MLVGFIYKVDNTHSEKHTFFFVDLSIFSFVFLIRTNEIYPIITINDKSMQLHGQKFFSLNQTHCKLLYSPSGGRCEYVCFRTNDINIAKKQNTEIIITTKTINLFIIGAEYPLPI